MNHAAIRHESTQHYCCALEPGKFRIRLETAKNDMTRVTLWHRDKYMSPKLKKTLQSLPMEKVASDGYRDYYEVELSFQMVCLRYYFELESVDGVHTYLGNTGFVDWVPDDVERMFDCPQTLREEECFVTPQWAHHKVVYQIFPARFASDKGVSDKLWYRTPMTGNLDIGGNLRGIISRLDYIRDLGADVIYMTPIFASPSAHKYNTVDYYTIDPAFGTEEDLCELVEKAHSKGMRVVLDAVFNHSGTEFFAFEDLKKNGEASAYRDWYYTQSLPVKQVPFKPNYKCFGYFGYMPKLNMTNPETADYFINVALYWLRRAKIDGWRLDVGDEVSHTFWRKFRTAIKAEFPEALIVGEIWHHAPDFLEGDQWDSVMNYPFFRAIMDFVAGDGISATAFLGRLGELRGSVAPAAWPVLWNLVGSHDTPRLRYCCGENREKHRLAAALQLLSPGMPMIYYGDEVGLTGGPDPDCRRGMLWDPQRQDQEMLRWYKSLIRARRKESAITQGKTVREDAWDEEGLIRIRRSHEGREVTLLFHSKPGRVSLPELTGKRDLITGKLFTGTLDGITALALQD